MDQKPRLRWRGEKKKENANRNILASPYMPATVRLSDAILAKDWNLGTLAKQMLSFWNPSRAEQVDVLVSLNPNLNLKHLKKWVMAFTLHLLLWIRVRLGPNGGTQVWNHLSIQCWERCKAQPASELKLRCCCQIEALIEKKKKKIVLKMQIPSISLQVLLWKRCLRNLAQNGDDDRWSQTFLLLCVNYADFPSASL